MAHWLRRSSLLHFLTCGLRALLPPHGTKGSSKRKCRLRLNRNIAGALALAPSGLRNFAVPGAFWGSRGTKRLREHRLRWPVSPSGFHGFLFFTLPGWLVGGGGGS